ncbi:MAG: GspE/PulE family protein [Candidatus Doudnabacteria bacterium]|nr:GspE/PulE family protein [Candidatus Doudnabacteria bacterium]
MIVVDPSTRAQRVQQVYTDLNRKFEEEETQLKARNHSVPYISLYGFPVDQQVLNLLDKETSQAYGCIIFHREGKNLKLGFFEPASEIKKVLDQLALKGFTVDSFLISKSSFEHFFKGYDLFIKPAHRSDNINLNSKDDRFTSSAIKNLSQQISSGNASQTLEALIGTALMINVSDIHIEPEKTLLKIRFRIDGVLQDTATANMDTHHQLVSRIKILSKMKLNVTSMPQDGSFSLTYDDNPVDIRTSVLPSAFGESIVLRILRQDKGSLEFDELGIMGLAKDRILKEMEKPNGMILTTGPTGSGKTTTLYAILNKLNEPGIKIITIEDPVEYKIQGITQTPIDARAGMNFADALRSILRQDPDIVMVGEMRDLETAETGCQAALTGHTVLSTLHTNDAPSAIPRLLDLGVKPFVLAPAINAIIAQRLIRKICDNCKSAYLLPANLQSRVEMILRAIPKSSQAQVPSRLVFYHSTGCDKCHGLGYRGRLGIYEVFTISDEIEKLITKGATTTEIKKQAIEEGMITMAQDGILKALQGITDIEEVFRVTEE